MPSWGDRSRVAFEEQADQVWNEHHLVDSMCRHHNLSVYESSLVYRWARDAYGDCSPGSEGWSKAHLLAVKRARKWSLSRLGPCPEDVQAGDVAVQLALEEG